MKMHENASMPFYVTLLFSLCLAILGTTAISSYRNLERLKQNNSDMERSWLIEDHLKNINLLITDAEDGVLGYYISGDQAALNPLRNAQDDLSSEFASLERLLAGNSIQQAHLAQLHDLFNRRMEKLEEHTTRLRRGGLRDAVDIVKRREGAEIMDEVRLLEVTMEKDELESLAASRNRFYAEFDRSLLAGYLASGFAILILVTYYRLIRQHLEKRRVAEEVLKRTNENLETAVSLRTAKLSILTRHLLSLSEIEKAKLARELHDEMGANLTAICMDVSIVTEKLKKIDPLLAGQLGKTKQTLQETVDLKRRIIEDLRPSMLDTLGLAASIRTHCEKVVRVPGLEYEEDIEEAFDDIQPEWSIALFRIVQESLSNVIKYAKATRVRIALKREAKGLKLRILDNGVGIRPEDMEKAKSHGLLGMRERILLLGGKFSVGQGMEKRGTSIDVFLPYSV
ncbi:MAG: CHASE3 domain-containing protein [Burkholderiaceae bacterium]|nr:CHASE3 domain-containing protein [Burkholderiaceae bacterium]